MDPSSAVRTVDLTAWRGADPDARAAAVAELDRSMRHAGFALVVGHDIPDEVRNAVRTSALDFFHLDEGGKRPYEAPGLGTRGWVPYGAEANAYASGAESPPDMKESYVCTTSDLPGHDDALAGVWPDEVPTLRHAANAYLAAVDALHLELLEMAAVALGADDPTWFTTRAGHGSAMNVNWYPPMASVGSPLPGQWRIGPHTDFGTITLLDREPGLGGLQVQLGDGTWIDAPWIPGSLAVNCGDLFTAWSNGRWRSAPHRVLPPHDAAPDESLVSLIYFCEADPSVEIAPIPGVDEAGAFEPFNAGEYLQAKLAQITVG